MKSLLLGLSIAAMGAVTAAHATLSIVQIASPGNWSAFDNVGVGLQSGSTTTNSGSITFTTDGNVAVGTNVNVNAAPAGDASNYLWGVRGATSHFCEGGQELRYLLGLDRRQQPQQQFPCIECGLGYDHGQ